ncbi:hypothetical protein GOV14_04570 [Candidatus Pacearchaeota archaeon]|nr:hypothetical protein [Candidatus Pacearchaeota archaeon]
MVEKMEKEKDNIERMGFETPYKHLQRFIDGKPRHYRNHQSGACGVLNRLEDGHAVITPRIITNLDQSKAYVDNGETWLPLPLGTVEDLPESLGTLERCAADFNYMKRTSNTEGLILRGSKEWNQAFG